MPPHLKNKRLLLLKTQVQLKTLLLLLLTRHINVSQEVKQLAVPKRVLQKLALQVVKKHVVPKQKENMSTRQVRSMHVHLIVRKIAVQEKKRKNNSNHIELKRPFR